MAVEAKVDQALAAIRALAWKATSLVGEDFDYWCEHGEEPAQRKTPQVAEAIETAFLQLLALTESLKLQQLSELIRETYQEAKRVGLGNIDTYEDYSAWSVWSGPVEQFADAIGAVFGSAKPAIGAVSADLLTLLQNMQTAITDRRCFEPPKEEKDVHARIEAILRCVYGAVVQRKPPIAKPVVHFIPDTGIRSIETCIEYKFLSDESQIGPIANEILADTRGYAQSDWKRIVFVIYETRRFKTVEEWRQLLIECGVTENIALVVLHGENVERKAKSPPPIP